MDIKILLGKRIKELRKSRNFTQEYLAELIGIETVSLSNIERGKYYPSADNLNKLLKILNYTPEDLFIISHNKTQKELLEEIICTLKDNENLTKLVYKFLKTIK